jgi:hypothetical protein
MNMEDDDYVELVGLIGKYGIHEVLNAVASSQEQYFEETQADLLNALELARDHLEVCNHEGEEDEALAQINAAINNAIGKAND